MLRAAVVVACLLASTAEARLLAGVAQTDLTPASGGEFFGYVRPDIRADGVALRLTARALVLDDGVQKLALVTVDLQGPQGEDFGSPTPKDSLLSRLAGRGFTHENVLLAGTHTHAGPTEFSDFLVEQIARAVRRADDARAPALAGWATAALEDASNNRSIEAHLADHGFDLPRGDGSPALDPFGPLHTIDPPVSVLRIDRETPEGSEPLAAWAHFAAHATNFVPANTTFSSDWPGVAVRRFAARLGPGAPLAVVTNGTEGDVSPRFDGANQHVAADEMGQRVARAMEAAWTAAASTLSPTIPLDARWTRVCFCGQEFAPGQRVSPVPIWGLAFIGGAEDGPSIFHDTLMTEGQRRPEELADPVQGRKILFGPTPYTTTPEAQVVRVGDRLLAAVPGEPTVELGRRLRAAVAPAAPADIAETLVVGLANHYTGYYTTPEEYDQQHYEGGHTVFGLWSGNFVVQSLRDLALAMAAGVSAPPPATVPPAGSTDPGTPPTGDGGVAGALVAGPSTIERMQTLHVVWEGGTLGRDRPVDDPFLLLERQRPDGGWTVADTDLGWAFVWREGDGEYRARYDVAHDFPTGTYRVRIQSARYTLATDPFALLASTGLRVRGATAEPVGDSTQLDFVAQNPPPDPADSILSRPREPAGGSLRFQLEGREHIARWDPVRGTWSALVPGDATAATVHVEPGALRDGLGNDSLAQPPTDFVVRQVAPLDWPPSIGPGGGPPPGPGGQGTFPP